METNRHTSNSNLIITNDKHFNCLKDNDFPEVNLMNIEEFRELLF